MLEPFQFTLLNMYLDHFAINENMKSYLLKPLSVYEIERMINQPHALFDYNTGNALFFTAPQDWQCVQPPDHLGSTGTPQECARVRRAARQSLSARKGQENMAQVWNCR